MKKYLSLVLMIAMAAFATVSCEKDNTRPTPPSTETLSINLHNVPLYSSVTKAGDVDPGYTATIDRLNNVLYGIWEHVYTAIVNIPIGCFDAAIKAEPIDNGNGQWTWESTYANWGVTYGVLLIGTDRGDKVDWELQVSREGFGGFENFPWIKGWSYKDGHAGQWNILIDPYDTEVIVSADWAATKKSVERVKLTYELEHRHGLLGEFMNGSYIEFAKGATDKAYDSSLAVHYEQDLFTLNITALVEWNSKNGACRIQSDVFGNDEWHIYKK